MQVCSSPRFPQCAPVVRNLICGLLLCGHSGHSVGLAQCPFRRFSHAVTTGAHTEVLIHMLAYVANLSIPNASPWTTAIMRRVIRDVFFALTKTYERQKDLSKHLFRPIFNKSGMFLMYLGEFFWCQSLSIRRGHP